MNAHTALWLVALLCLALVAWLIASGVRIRELRRGRARLTDKVVDLELRLQLAEVEVQLWQGDAFSARRDAARRVGELSRASGETRAHGALRGKGRGLYG